MNDKKEKEIIILRNTEISNNAISYNTIFELCQKRFDKLEREVRETLEVSKQLQRENDRLRHAVFGFIIILAAIIGKVIYVPDKIKKIISLIIKNGTIWQNK